MEECSYIFEYNVETLILIPAKRELKFKKSLNKKNKAFFYGGNISIY